MGLSCNCPLRGKVEVPYRGNPGAKIIFVGECYSEDTEYLTDSGWKLFLDLSGRELFYSLNPESQQIELVNAVKRIRKPYNGPMYHYTTRSVDLLVTPEHILYAGTSHTRNFKLQAISNIKSNTFEMTALGKWKSTVRTDSSLMKFLGFWLGDGMKEMNNRGYRIRFSFKKSRKIDYVESLLETMNIKYSKWSNTTSKTNKGKTFIDIYNKDLYLWLPNEKRVPKFVFGSDVTSQLSLLDGMMESDGNRRTGQIYQSRKGLMDDLQRVCFLCGQPSTLSYRDRDEVGREITPGYPIKSTKRAYTLILKKNKVPFTLSKNKSLKVERYSGYVNDVTLERNHILVVRRNGRVILGSNSPGNQEIREGAPFVGPCYDPETEVLTDSGWKYFYELDGSELFYSVNPINQKIEFLPALRHIERDYSGKMYVVKGRSIDLLVSPEHKVYTRCKASALSKRPFCLLPISDVSWISFEMTSYGTWQGVQADYSDEKLKFLGFWLGDGSKTLDRKGRRKRIGFGFKKQRKIQYLNSLLSSLKYHSITWNVESVPGKVGYEIYNDALFDWLPEGGAHEKRIPEDIFSLTPHQQLCVLDGMLESDGNRTRSHIYSANKELMGDFQRLCFLCGHGANISERSGRQGTIEGRSINSSEFQYTLCILKKGKNYCLSSKKNIEEVPYKGKIHDVTLPRNHVLLVRRNGKMILSGNSGQLLMETIGSVGIDPQSVFYTNASRCKLEKDTMPSADIKGALSACRSFLTVAIREIKPKIIVALGAIAAEQILRVKGIKAIRGKFLWSEEFRCYVLPMWHPAYILRNRSELENFQMDMSKLAQFKKDEYAIEEIVSLQYQEVDTILPLLNGGFMKEDGGINPALTRGLRVIRTKIPESNCPFVTAIDTETQGLTWYDPNSIIISYSVAASMTLGWTVYLHEEVLVGEGDFDIRIQRGGTKKKPTYITVGIKRVPGYDRKVEELRELCRRKDIKKYFANQKYDMHRLYNLGITEINNAPMDIMLASHCIDSERFLNNTLEQLVDTFTNITYNFKDLISEGEKSDMLQTVRMDRDRVSRYACGDACGTLSAAVSIKKELLKDEKTLNYFARFVQPSEVNLLFELERNGVLVDVEHLPQVREGIQQNIQNKVQEFLRKCPREVVDKHKDSFRLTRRAILLDALFDYTVTNKEGVKEDHKLGFHILPLQYSAKSGLPVCDKDVMSQILDQPHIERAKEIIHIYREWSDYHTLLTRYIKNIENNLDADGRMHPTYSFKFTSSGRTGARNPSIQNFPVRGPVAHLIQSLIIASSGKKLLEADFSMSELRWVAHVADERKMKEVFQKGGDLHMLTGLEVLGITQEEAKLKTLEELEKIRQNAKAVNFGLIYGMSAATLRIYARASYGVKLSRREAENWRNTFFRLYPDLLLWHKESMNTIESNGSIRHVFGRKRSLPNVYSQDNKVRAEAIRIGTNFVIQGPSSDATLMGHNNVINHPDYNPLECRAIMFHHDSFIYEIDEDKESKYATLVKHSMENIDTTPYNFTLSVPLVVDIKTGYSRAEMTSFDLSL